jgi:hypothetical protein
MPVKRKLCLTFAAVLMLFGAACSTLPTQTEIASAQVTPLASCTATEIAVISDGLMAYLPALSTPFAEVADRAITVAGQRYPVRGVNYYPSRFPWRRFLTQTDMATIEYEFGLLAAAGINTLRLFLWNEALFACPGNGLVPVAAAFTRLDEILSRANAFGFRVILTLNDLPDLVNYPLYDNPAHVVAQTRFIVERYRDEATILAWDLRNEGDIDYGTNSQGQGRFTREHVMTWLAETAELVRGLDPNHLITAGWLHDSESTVPYVDFVSFHHWQDANSARQRFATLSSATDKPILLQEFGYSTQRMDAESQARTIGEVISVVDETQSAGWMIWTAFDFPTDATCIPPACPSEDNAEHYFGLWTTDYTPKPAVAVLMSP